MRKKVKNPYNQGENPCFGCSDKNPMGLKLEFEESEKFLHARWNPEKHYQGYINILHGGIIATLMDETSAWCINVKAGRAGVTSEIRVKYLKPVFVNRGEITLEAGIIEERPSHIAVHCSLFDSSGNLCAESESLFFVYPDEIARRKFNFPGKEAFRSD
ncbi:MAG: PaaI family thioesterase [Bacteroidales bacterium]|nr:PaaI family thioesterase [Bacteroidales bacterium]